MYEHHREPLIPFNKFLGRLFNSFLIALAFIAFSLLMGAAGYHFTEKLSWLDSLLNAAMILGGMGPVDILRTTAGKLFATFYALYSGIAFLTVAAILLAPVIHRFLHRFHLQTE
ncbi:MAG TPA: hypothetical protein VMD02_03870 [Candidatus Omnitrophota bacterium]|nr:hypothetical protein [Candidatus Omnitrophota bacterium]